MGDMIVFLSHITHLYSQQVGKNILNYWCWTACVKFPTRKHIYTHAHARVYVRACVYICKDLPKETPPQAGARPVVHKVHKVVPYSPPPTSLYHQQTL